MNEASRWRQALARQIAPAYATNPKVAAVVVGGSSARGHADRYSDIEIGVFWHEPPADEERRSAVERVGGDLIRLYPYDPAEQVWCDDYTMGRRAPDLPGSGVLIELVNYTTAFMESVLADVVERYDTSDLKQSLIAGVCSGIALHGDAVIERWQEAASRYPDELAVRMVNAHALIDHYWRVEAMLERNNPGFVYRIFTEVEQKLLHVLLGLNRVYYFGSKWQDQVVEPFRIAPPDLVARLRRVYHVDPAEGGRQLATLVEETYDRVEQHLPAVDVGWFRRVFQYRRPAWERPPPGLPCGGARAIDS
jgi:hypothetical protein